MKTEACLVSLTKALQIRLCVALLLVLPFVRSGYAQHATLDDSLHRYFNWKPVARLSPSAGAAEHPGLAGAFAGVSNGVLIIAGGANFPDAAPWKGGKKVWWDKIQVLEKNRGGILLAHPLYLRMRHPAQLAAWTKIFKYCD
jgi:hypothetical protein